MRKKNQGLEEDIEFPNCQATSYPITISEWTNVIKTWGNYKTIIT